MIYTFEPKGVCPSKIQIELDEDDCILNISALGGCVGNLKGIAALAKNLPAQEAASRLRGIKCSFKSTSCPDQIAVALEEYLKENQCKGAECDEQTI